MDGNEKVTKIVEQVVTIKTFLEKMPFDFETEEYVETVNDFKNKFNVHIDQMIQVDSSLAEKVNRFVSRDARNV